MKLSLKVVIIKESGDKPLACNHQYNESID